MTDRDRLIELFKEMDKDFGITCPNINTDKNCKGCKYQIRGAFIDCNYLERKVDYLLANGVFLLLEDLRGTQDFSISAFIEAMQMYKEKDRYIKLPCKVGDKVYILEEKCKYSGEKNEPWNSCKQYWDNVYKNGMWGCAGKDRKGNKIYCKQKELVWYTKEVEYSLLLYSDPTKVFGENLFLTKAEAEQKLKELK